MKRNAHTKTPTHAIRRVLGYLRHYPREIVLNIVFNLLSVVFNLFSFVLIVPVVELFFGLSTPPATAPELAFDQASITAWATWHVYALKESMGLWRALLAFGGAYLGCVLLYDLTRYLGFYFLSPIRNGIVQRLRNDIYRKLTVLPISYYAGHRKGDLLSRISADLADIEWSVVCALQSLVKDPINVLLFSATLLFISPRLFLLFLVVLPPAVLLIAKIGDSLKRNASKGQAKLGEMLSTYKESLDNLEVIEAYRREGYRQGVFEKANADYARRMIRVARRKEAGSPLSEVLGMVGLAFILVLGGNAVLGGELQASVFVLFVILFARLIPPVQSMVRAYSSLQKGAASANRVYEVLDADERIVERPDAVVMETLHEAIEYRDISFAYDDAQGKATYVLQHLNLRIPKGIKLAIVGPSGAGKTTLADLLPRFYDPTSGSVLIDGRDIRELNIDSLRRNIGVVSQRCILFNDSVLNNITFGMEGATPEAVYEAARIAGADAFIRQMAKGYDTPVGDHGSALSGGQRQRISIARAILRNPPILILDEATSALDNASQQAVQEALDELMRGRTTIVIAHRLSTIENADLIVVLDHGAIVQQGTHAELMAQEGLYRQMVDMQQFKK